MRAAISPASTPISHTGERTPLSRRSDSAILVAGKYMAPVIVVLFVLSGHYKAAPWVASLPVDVTAATGLICLVMVVSSIVRWRSAPRAVSRVAVYFLLLAVPIAWSDSALEYSREKLVALFTLTVLSMLTPVVLIRSWVKLRRFIWALAGVTAVMTVLAVVFRRASADYAGSRTGFFGGSPSLLGQVAGVLFIIVFLGLLNHLIPRVIGLPLIAFAVAALLASGTRAALFGAGLSVVATLALSKGWRRATKVVVLVPFVAISLFVAAGSTPIYALARVESSLQGILDDSSQARLSLGRLAWAEAKQHPEGGLGWGGFSTVSPDPVGMAYPHNVVLELLCETGFFITLALLILLGRLWWNVFRASTSFDGTVVLALLTFSGLQMLVTGTATDRLFAFLMGMGLALDALNRWIPNDLPDAHGRSTVVTFTPASDGPADG